MSSFIAQQITDAKRQGVLLSLHLKATMMKVSDPIMFGIVVSEFYKEVLARYNDKLKTLGFDANNGIGDLYAKIKELPAAEQTKITQAIEALYTERPSLAMVNSDKGITNLHVPSDVIVDASMPAMIRDSGKMWGPMANCMIPRPLFPTAAMPAYTRR
ncbi:Isocitrate dehydrogenase [NADP] [Sodalis praecaptivus]